MTHPDLLAFCWAAASVAYVGDFGGTVAAYLLNTARLGRAGEC